MYASTKSFGPKGWGILFAAIILFVDSLEL